MPLGTCSDKLDCEQMISLQDNGSSSKVLIKETMFYLDGPAM